MATRTVGLTAWLLLAAASAPALDWPQWRGPARNGYSSETNWLRRWPPVHKWTKNVGRGYSSVAVSEGRLYTMGHRAGVDWVYCLDANTGTQLWARSYACGAVDYDGTRSTPTVDGGQVYTYSHEGLLNCYNKYTGAPLWNLWVNGRLEYLGWHFASSPLIEGNLIFLNANGGAGVAIDKNTHQVVWTSTSGYPGYSSAVAFNLGTPRVLALLSNSGLYVVRPSDGATYWSYSYRNLNCADPIVWGGDKVFISNGYGDGGRLLQLRGDGTVGEVWTTDAMECQIATPVVVGNYMYGFDGDAGGGSLKCISMATGAERWSAPFTSGGLLATAMRLIVLGGDGRLAVLYVSPTAPNYEGRAPYALGAGTWWTMPVLANSKIYCRNLEGSLVCLDVGPNRPPWLVTYPRATPNPATGGTTLLSVAATDDGGEPGLTYTWRALTGPAAVTYSRNGSNAAKSTTATFTRSGTYGFAVTARDAGGLTCTGRVSVVVGASNRPPWLFAPPRATPNPVTGRTTVLSVSAWDDGGEPSLTYTWRTLTAPAAVTYSRNGSNAAKTATATFTRSGTYGFAVTVRDTGGLTCTGRVSVAVAVP